MAKFRVEQLAKAQKLTQEDLAARVRAQGVEVSLGTIQGIWQSRDRRYRADTLIAIARVLGVSVEDLYEGKPDLDRGDRSGVKSEHIVTPMVGTLVTQR